MVKLLVQWVLSAVALLVVSNLVRGFEVDGLVPALVAALVIGLLNATIGFLLKIISIPDQHSYAGAVSSGHQRDDDSAGFEHCARISCARLWRGILGRGGAGSAGNADWRGYEECVNRLVPCKDATCSEREVKQTLSIWTGATGFTEGAGAKKTARTVGLFVPGGQ